MDSNGVVWCYVCVCGHSWDSLVQRDTCWECGEVSNSDLDKVTRDVMAKRAESMGTDLPQKLLDVIAEGVEN